jgi:hypothetical protein
MFTKQQLAKWRNEGFVFPEFYDEVAVDEKKKEPKVVEYDDYIEFEKILRSNNSKLEITPETIKQDWPKLNQ